MEIYTLNNNLEREFVVDQFESLIWAERFTKIGDFELVVQSNPTNKSIFVLDTKLITNLSTRVMIVDTIEDTVSESGETLMHISGKSLENVLSGKNTYNALLPPAIFPQVWKIDGLPQDIIQEVFDYSSGLVGKSFYAPGNFYPTCTNPYPTTEIGVGLPVVELLGVIQELAELYGLGLRLVRNPVTAKLHFNIYTGIDRSSSQSEDNAVIFDPSLDNISNISYLQSKANYRICASVTNPITGATIVYPDTVDWEEASADWFNWKSVVVDTDGMDLDTSDPGYLNTIRTLGLEAISKHQQVDILDGDVPSNAYTYEKDYSVGDIVDMRSGNGLTNRMRVSEQILSDGPEGEKSYPTFELLAFITPGSWQDWQYNVEWINAAGEWSNQT